jgi:hypothetical protein
MISQISITSNTFGQWFETTQALVDKYNDFEETANLIFETSNNVSNTANTVFEYVVEAFDTANLAFDTANSALQNAQTASEISQIALQDSENAFDFANSAYNFANLTFETANAIFGDINVAYEVIILANSAYDTINIVYDFANAAFDAANSALAVSNIAESAANTANFAFDLANAVIQTVFNIEDETEDSNIYYPTFTPITVGVPNDVYVSSTKLYYVPSTGQLSATNFNSLSDQKKKNNIITLENALDSVLNMRGVSFTWIDNDQKSIGVIAQEIEKIIPEVVSTNENGEKSVSYGNLVGLLIEAIKELKSEIDDLKKYINNK